MALTVFPVCAEPVCENLVADALDNTVFAAAQLDEQSRQPFRQLLVGHIFQPVLHLQETSAVRL